MVSEYDPHDPYGAPIAINARTCGWLPCPCCGELTPHCDAQGVWHCPTCGWWDERVVVEVTGECQGGKNANHSHYRSF